MIFAPEHISPKPEHEELAARKAGLGVGHIWWQTKCPAYWTYDPAECTCKQVTR